MGVKISALPTATTPTGTEVIPLVQSSTTKQVALNSTPVSVFSSTVAAAQFPILTGDVTTPGASLTTTIAANAVTNTKMATMAANTVKANMTAGSAAPTDVAANAVVAVGSQTVSGSTATVTPGNNAQVNITLQASTTLTIGNGATDGQILKLRLLQDNSGSRTVAFDSSVVFGTDITSFTATTTANKVDLVGLLWDATKTKWLFLTYARGF